MAALTWREVSAPVLDTRGLAQAGAGITGAFDRLGDMLIKREDNLRSEATDAAIAQALALQDPAALSKLQAQGLAGLDKRVRARDYMEALGLRQNQLIDTDMKNNQRLDALALTNNADLLDRLGKARLAGDQEAIAGVMAEFNAREDGKRALGQNWSKFIDIDDTGIDNRLADTTERRNAWEGQQEAGARWAGVRIAQAAEQRQATEFARRVAEEARAQALNADADRVAGELLGQGHTDVAEIAVGIKRSNKYNNLKTAAEKEDYLNAIVDRVTNKTTRSTREQEALGMPHFSTVYADAGAQAGITKNVLTKQFNDSNPNLAITEAVSARKAPATQKEAVDAFETMLKGATWGNFSTRANALADLKEGIADRTIDPTAVAELLKAEDLRPGFWAGPAQFFERARSATEYLNNGNPLLDRGTRDVMLKDVTRVERDLTKAMRSAEEYLRNDKPVPAALSQQVRELSRQAQVLRQKPPKK